PSSSHLYPLSLHDALPISLPVPLPRSHDVVEGDHGNVLGVAQCLACSPLAVRADEHGRAKAPRMERCIESIQTRPERLVPAPLTDRKSTRLNSSHVSISYA